MYISLYRPLLQASPTTPSVSASTRPGRSPSLTTTTTSTWPSSLRTASSSPRWRARYDIICNAQKHFVSQERISGQKIFPVYLKIFGCRWSTRNVSTCRWWMTAAWCWPARTTASTSTDTSRCRPSASRYLDISRPDLPKIVPRIEGWKKSFIETTWRSNSDLNCSSIISPLPSSTTDTTNTCWTHFLNFGSRKKKKSFVIL